MFLATERSLSICFSIFIRRHLRCIGKCAFFALLAVSFTSPRYFMSAYILLKKFLLWLNFGHENNLINDIIMMIIVIWHFIGNHLKKVSTTRIMRKSIYVLRFSEFSTYMRMCLTSHAIFDLFFRSRIVLFHLCIIDARIQYFGVT